MPAARRRRRSATLLLVVLFVASLPAVTTRLYAADEIEYFAFLRSWWFDRDVSFDNEYRYFHDRGISRAFGFEQTFLTLQTPTGLRLNFGTIGCAILWAPFYGAADVGVHVARRLGSDVPADGFSTPYLAAIAYGSAVYGFLAVLLSASVSTRIAGRGNLAAVLIWLSTPLLFYMYVAPGMAHACSAFMVAAFVALWLRVRDTWTIGGMAALGAVGALMVMVREQDVLIAVGPAVDYVWAVARLVRRREPGAVGQSLRGAVVAGVVAGVVYLPQVATYLALNGRIGPARQVSNKMIWTSPHALDVLFSTEHGLFWWTPIALLAMIGLVWLVARPPERTLGAPTARWIGMLALLMVAGQIYVNGSIETWSQAGAFGQRRFVGLTVFFVLGTAQLLTALPRVMPRWTVSILVGVCVWWNLGLMAQFGAGLMDRQRLELTRNAYHTFVTVPLRGPELAYRYVFDRSSFYKLHLP